MTALLPGKGIGSIIAKNALAQGIKDTEKLITGNKIDLKNSVINIANDSIFDSSFSRGSDIVTSKITDNLTPRNYSSFAGKQYKINPSLTRDQIYKKMHRIGKAVKALNVVIDSGFEFVRILSNEVCNG